MRQLTKHDHNLLQEAIDNSDGIFECVERVIGYVLEQHPEIEECLEEDDYLQWRVVLEREIGDGSDDGWDANGRGPEPLLDKP